jgi:hypothetical protein
MEDILSSEKSVLTKATGHLIPENGILHSCRRENLRSYIEVTTIPVTGFGGLSGCEVSRIPHCLDNRLITSAKMTALRAGRALPPGYLLVLISVRGWINPWPMVRLERLGKWKHLTTSSALEPETFCHITQLLNHISWRNEPTFSMPIILIESLGFLKYSEFLMWLENWRLLNHVLSPWNKRLSEWVGCKIWGFHSGDYEEWCLLGCYTVWRL